MHLVDTLHKLTQAGVAVVFEESYLDDAIKIHFRYMGLKIYLDVSTKMLKKADLYPIVSGELLKQGFDIRDTEQTANLNKEQ